MERKARVTKIRVVRWRVDAHTLIEGDHSVVSPYYKKLMEDNPSIIAPGGNARAIRATEEQYNGKSNF